MHKAFTYLNLLIISTILLFVGGYPFSVDEKESDTVVATEAESSTVYRHRLYSEMGLAKVLDFDIFEKAMVGYEKLTAPNKNIFTIIDYSKPSTAERMFVLDIENRKVLYSTLVAHGKRSGENYATTFSNKVGSNMSSLGFFVTENTYQGRNGYSLIIDGLEKGINDKAKVRSVVIHGAAYANPAVIKNGNRLGRSQGCPALPQNITKPVINAIKDGTLLFIYANDKSYTQTSSILAGTQRFAAK